MLAVEVRSSVYVPFSACIPAPAESQESHLDVAMPAWMGAVPVHISAVMVPGLANVVQIQLAVPPRDRMRLLSVRASDTGQNTVVSRFASSDRDSILIAVKNGPGTPIHLAFEVVARS